MANLLRIAIMILALWPKAAAGYSANKVWFDFMDNGRYRVRVQYTVPALKEFREAYAVFQKRKEAEAFYWHLVKGGDFSVGAGAQLRFEPVKAEATPW